MLIESINAKNPSDGERVFGKQTETRNSNMFRLATAAQQFGGGNGNKAVKQTEQSPHFGCVADNQIGLSDFGNKQGNRQADPGRHADQQQVQVGNCRVDVELHQTSQLDQCKNSECFAKQQGNENNEG